MSGLHWVVCAVAALVYGAFALGVLTTFRRSERPSRGLAALSLCAVVAGAAEVGALSRVRTFHPAFLATGVGMYLAAWLLYRRCAKLHRPRPLGLAFTREPPGHLVTHGPYRWVRHPFYSAYLMAYVAGLVASRDLRLLVVVAGMSGLYALAALHEERQFARGPLAAPYAAYRRRTGSFFPRPWRAARPPRPPPS